MDIEDLLGDVILSTIGLLSIFILMFWFIHNYINLQKFKSCYDINFQDVKCQKYINY